MSPWTSHHASLHYSTAIWIVMMQVWKIITKNMYENIILSKAPEISIFLNLSMSTVTLRHPFSVIANSSCYTVGTHNASGRVDNWASSGNCLEHVVWDMMRRMKCIILEIGVNGREGDRWIEKSLKSISHDLQWIRSHSCVPFSLVHLYILFTF